MKSRCSFPLRSGRWVRLTIDAVAGPNWSDFQVYEMQIHGADITPNGDQV